MAYQDNFIVYGPYSRKDKRQIVIVVDHNGKKRTVSFPKWIMECYLGRELDEDLETVDHINSNFLDNDIQNLQLLPRDQHSAEDIRRVKLVKLTCVWCEKEFERSPRLVRSNSKKGNAGPFCSRSCAAKYSRRLQLKLIEKFDKQPLCKSEYYKRKYASVIVNMNCLLDFIFDIWEN